MMFGYAKFNNKCAIYDHYAKQMKSLYHERIKHLKEVSQQLLSKNERTSIVYLKATYNRLIVRYVRPPPGKISVLFWLNTRISIKESASSFSSIVPLKAL